MEKQELVRSGRCRALIGPRIVPASCPDTNTVLILASSCSFVLAIIAHSVTKIESFVHDRKQGSFVIGFPRMSSLCRFGSCP